MENVIIVGSGPAGYTAALYTARANLRPLVIEGFLWGGLLQQTTDVENYPGFPDGITGPELMKNLRHQAQRFGARLITDKATRIDLANQPGSVHHVSAGDHVYAGRTVILTMGAEHKKLGASGEAELSGMGVSYCATCDAAFFKGKASMVVGGGDSAMEEAIFLSKFASKVTVIHRRSNFRASKIMLDRARTVKNIEFLTPFEVEAFVPGSGGRLERARLRDLSNGEKRELPIEGAFIAVGHTPQSGIVEHQVPTDPDGYILTEGKSTRTGLPGVLAAGDLVDRTYRQAVTAAGSGCQAALDAEWYLRDMSQC